MGQNDSNGDGEEWLDPGYNLKVRSTGFTDGLKCSVKKKEVSGMISMFLCWATGRLGLLFSETQKTTEEPNLG